MTDTPILVLSPHPDDAVLGCWSALDDGETPAVVVNLFAGLPPTGTSGGWDRECGVSNSREMMRRRHEEDTRALAVAGAEVVNLDWLDRQYVDEARDVERIAAAVRLALPDGWSALYAPAGLGGYTPLLGTAGMTLAPHPDHETARTVAQHLERPNVPTRFYAELVYGLGARRGRRWPHVLGDFTPVLEAATRRRLELELVELSDEALKRRIAAMSLYRTQLTRLEDGVGSFLGDPDLVRYEAYWRSPAPGKARGIPRLKQPR